MFILYNCVYVIKLRFSLIQLEQRQPEITKHARDLIFQKLSPEVFRTVTLTV